MVELKNKLNKLIEKHGLRHKKVISFSQKLDKYIVLEQREILCKHKNGGC